MFLDTSRYFQVEAETVADRDGREVRAVKLRRLPYVPGAPRAVKDNDRLDVIAQRQYGDATRFWHVADANTELEAGKLLAEAGATVLVPDK